MWSVQKSMGIVIFLGLGVVTPTQASASSYNSHAVLEYYQNEDITNPVDPLDPSVPLEPVDPSEPGTPGPLSVDYVSNINFSSQKISGKDQIYYAKLSYGKSPEGNQFEFPNYVQVTDNRGSNNGWKLTVSQSEPLNVNGIELEGTSIHLDNGISSGLNELYKPVSNTNVEIKPDGTAENVVVAAQGTGMGTWTNRFGKDTTEAKQSISLFVPGSTKKVIGHYTSKLTWVLLDSAL